MHARWQLTEVHRARWPSVWRSADSDSRQQWPGPRGTSGCAPVSGVWGRAVHLYTLCTVSMYSVCTLAGTDIQPSTLQNTRKLHTALKLSWQLCIQPSSVIVGFWLVRNTCGGLKGRQWFFVNFAKIHSLDYKILNWHDLEIIFNVPSSNTIETEKFI